MRTGKFIIGILLLCCFIRMVSDRGAMYCAFGEHGADVALRRSALD